AGGSFGLTQFIVSNVLDYALTDVLSSLGSLIVTLAFLKAWKPPRDPAFEVTVGRTAKASASGLPAWQGWLPWAIVTVVVILWTTYKVYAIGQQAIPWPGLDKAIAI